MLLVLALRCCAGETPCWPLEARPEKAGDVVIGEVFGIELDKGICCPVPGLIHLVGAQGVQGLSGRRRGSFRSSCYMRSWALAV